MSTFREKYLKYKNKYLALKNQLGGLCDCGKAECPECAANHTETRAAIGAAASATSNAFSFGAAAPTPANMGAFGDAIPLVHVYSMTGVHLTYPITRDMTIMDLKKLIEEDPKFIHPFVARQKLVLMPSFEPLANERTLVDCGILDGTRLELLLVQLPIDNIARVQIMQSIRQNNVDKLTFLLSQYMGQLFLMERDINDEGAICLANALKGNTSITSLVLALNRIGDDGAIALADMLRENTSITKINLVRNRIGDMGRAALQTVQAERPDLIIKLE